jgi:hypothetical protein
MKAILAAVAAIALGPQPAFPPPKLTSVTADTKCDWGAITEVRQGDLVIVKTDAGPFEARFDKGMKIAGPDGGSTSSSALRAGQYVRVYYLVVNKVGGGAMAQEIDLVPAPASPPPG